MPTPAVVEDLRSRVRTRTASRADRLLAPDPPPRYDDVYRRGTAWLDSPDRPPTKD